MEPRIPDGSLNLFRLHPAGSRQGKILLIERFGVVGPNRALHHQALHQPQGRTGEDEWRHEQIRLEPLNPEFEAVGRRSGGFRRRRRMAARHRVKRLTGSAAARLVRAAAIAIFPGAARAIRTASGSPRSCCSRPAPRR